MRPRPPCPRARAPLAGTLPWAALVSLASLPAAQRSEDAAERAEDAQERAEDAARAALPPLERAGEEYETPRAGDGFWTRLFGKQVHVFPEDRRSVTAFDVGLTYTRGVSDFELLPHGSLFFWRRPDEDHLLRAVVAAVYNEVLWARSWPGWGDFETVLGFQNLTPPFGQSELVDGDARDEEALIWGSARGVLGVGWRRQVAPYEVDNMLSFTLTWEPGYLYFAEDSDSDASFVEPRSTFTQGARLAVKWDALQRNLLELAHEGTAAGADLLYVHRDHWSDWGIGGREDGGEHRDSLLATAYALRAGGIPGAGDRHRVIGTVHAGVGDGLDRFSAPRVGGGPSGSEFLALSRPLVRGAVPNEFSPEHYVVSSLEYRFEPVFFSYLSVLGGLSWLDRDRERDGDTEREDDVLSSIGVQLTTAFFWSTRLRLAYDYNCDLIRDGARGGHAVTMQIARGF